MLGRIPGFGWNESAMKNWRRFLENRAAAVSLAFILLVTLLAIFAPWVTRHSFDEQNIAMRLQGPSWQYWMGTDMLGRDLYSRIIYGARTSLEVGVFTALFSLVLGTITGAIAGYLGGWVDHVLMRLVDIFYI